MQLINITDIVYNIENNTNITKLYNHAKQTQICNTQLSRF